MTINILLLVILKIQNIVVMYDPYLDLQRKNITSPALNYFEKYGKILTHFGNTLLVQILYNKSKLCHYITKTIYTTLCVCVCVCVCVCMHLHIYIYIYIYIYI